MLDAEPRAARAHGEPVLIARSLWLLSGVAFFASGCGALAFETLWFRQASLAFGNSVWASSIVLSGFMGGMACGHLAGARVARRSHNPLRLFAALELMVALSGIALVYLLPQLTPLLARASATLEQAPGALAALRLGLAFALLLLPSTAMGMSLPVLVHALATQHAAADVRFGRMLGALYGINTLGAVVGTLVAETLLIGLLGIRLTALAAGSCSVLAAALALLATTYAQPPARAARLEQPSQRGAARWWAASFLAGFSMLGLEVIWLRFLMLFVNDTDQAFAWVLSGVLAGIALGALLAAAWSALSTRVAEHASVIAFAGAVLGVLSYRAELYLIPHHFRMDQSAFVISLPLTVPAALLSGVLFTLLGAGLRRAVVDGAHAASHLAFFNTLGGMAGSALAGFVLLPRLGIEKSLFALVLLYALIGALLWRPSARVRVANISALAAVIALACFPFGGLSSLYLQGSVGRWMRPGDQLVSTREGVSATFAHVLHRIHGQPWFDQLATNAYSMSVNDFAARRYMKQFVYLPRALHPQLQRALVIGYGIGSTVSALLDDPRLSALDLVDISREGLALSREMLTVPGKPALDDPRVHVHIEDGRHFLAGHDGGYDLITGEPPPPIIAGVVNLYTREYFELVRSRLAPGGMASYWLPLMNLSADASHAIVRGFCEAFDDCSLWHGSARNFMLLGTRDAHVQVSAEQFARQWQEPAVAGELAAVGFELPEQLGAAFIGDAAYLNELTRGTPPLTDDRPKRIAVEGPREQRDALIWEWRDTTKARERFQSSPLIARLWPPGLAKASLRQFENQRLINDLLFPEVTPVRQTRVLHTVLHATGLQLPVLLLLGSDPDIQRVLAAASSEERERPEWLMHRVAGYLASRNYSEALTMLARVPREALPLTDLPEYLDFVIKRDHDRP